MNLYLSKRSPWHSKHLSGKLRESLGYQDPRFPNEETVRNTFHKEILRHMISFRIRFLTHPA